MVPLQPQGQIVQELPNNKRLNRKGAKNAKRVTQRKARTDNRKGPDGFDTKSRFLCGFSFAAFAPLRFKEAW